MAFPVVYTPEPSRPASGAKPGTKILLEFAIGTFDVAVHGDDIKNLGIHSPRDICGNMWPKWRCIGSQHARGAAGDAGVRVVRPDGHPEGHRLANWLVKNHAALGVQEVIWAGRRWDNQVKAWKAYTGRSDHFDHVHFAQTQQAANELTLAMIQAVWANEPSADSEDDDMPYILFGTHNGEKHLVVGQVRTDINDAEVNALKKTGVQVLDLAGSAFDKVKNSLAANLTGLRSFPPEVGEDFIKRIAAAVKASP